MNDFDENVSNDKENVSGASEINNTENSQSEKKSESLQSKDNTEDNCKGNNDVSCSDHSAAQQVVFNADGTYRSITASERIENVTHEEKENSAENITEDKYVSNNAQFNSYSAAASEKENNDQKKSTNAGNVSGTNPPPPPYGSYPYGNYPYGYPPFDKRNNAYAYTNDSVYGKNNNNMNNENMNPYAYYYGYKKKKNNAQIFAIVAAVLFAVIMGILVLILIGDKLGNLSPASSETTNAAGESQNVDEFVTNASPEMGVDIYEDGTLTPNGIYKKVLPSSVGILVYDKTGGLASEGSGVFFMESKDSKYTYIITCAHVINDASGYIVVQSYDGKEYDAEVVGYDTRTDIGVLRINKTGFVLAEIGDSSMISVGDPVYAIGNPGGVEFANSFTNGMVSALDRPVNSSATGYTTDCIQHTSAINPGNSGGALINSFGQVIGINSMKIVADEYEGMGFAVPSSVFQGIINEIMTHGYVTNRPKLGITYVPASQYSNYGMFVAIKGLPAGSIVIYSIASDSSLAETEVEAGDMIVGVNGNELTDASILAELVENSEVGDTLTLSIVRIHEDYTYDEFDVTVTLVEDRGNMTVEESASEDNSYSGGLDDYFRDYFGE